MSNCFSFRPGSMWIRDDDPRVKERSVEFSEMKLSGKEKVIHGSDWTLDVNFIRKQKRGGGWWVDGWLTLRGGVYE